MESGADIHVLLRMNCNNVGYLLSFRLIPSDHAKILISLILWFMTRISANLNIPTSLSYLKCSCY